MTSSSLDSKGRAKLDAFMAQVLAPLSGGDVIDTHFNALSRRASLKAWAKAEREVTFYKALHKAASWVPHDKDERCNFLGADGLPTRVECLERLRGALVKLLLTPAPQKAALNWKKREKITYLPVDKGLVAKAIAEDEAFLAARPVRTTKRGTV